MQQERKLVIFYVDGTLISKDKVLPNGVKEALSKLRNNGHVAVFFTGRPYSHVLTSVKELGFDGCICCLGTFIKIGEEVVQYLTPDPSMTPYLIGLAHEADLEITFEGEEGIRFDHSKPLSEYLCKLKAGFASRGFDTEKRIDQEPFCYSKMCVWLKENSDVGEFEKEASKYLKIIARKKKTMELVSKDASIESSVAMVMEHFAVSRENCYAIGGSVSELPMLHCAGHSAAVGDADDALKNQVEYVTTNVMEDGIVNFLRHYDLI